MMKLQLTLDGQDVALESGRFPDGAVWERVSGPLDPQAESLTLRASAMQTLDDLMRVAQVLDAVRQRCLLRQTRLELPWLPYARQDRTMREGDSFALRVFAGFLNQLRFDRVVVLDPHSDVAAAVVDRMVTIPQHRCLVHSPSLLAALEQGMMLIAPDAGALKKVHALAQQVKAAEYGILGKHRDIASGALSGFELLKGDVAGRDVLIADDLCDAGGTFIGSASVLRAAGARSVSLYVTHGLFSKGVEHLLSQGIDRIWTTTSLGGAEPAQEGVERVDIATIYRSEGANHAN
ncbi:ribose-phosphate diphosphokinase [Erwinia sp. Leaf53]|uniref:ribose-phosphate diphosphokinase n=1 Tax=Erwinia sp. Leaf53 TaxID=1736225 RepID=UPI0007015A9C|nr:ribose-phosphate diphosphokinase [Erwinia sp. Leaf53]KQN63972.1 ribose-phosphate pyrophosphokinase [Erwinia sp. Leaf53]